MITLSTKLASIHGLNPRFLARLSRLNIETVRDLLWHFPSRYEDFSQIYSISDLEPGQQTTIQGMVEDVSVRRTWQRHLIIVEAKVTDETGSIRAIWFNQPYIKNVLRPGRRANFSGKVAITDGEIYLSHPTYELVGAEETKHTARLVPIYPETKGLTSKGLRFLIQPIVKNLEQIPEWLPDPILEKNALPEINDALAAIHFPLKIEDAMAAKKRFSFEDLFLLQLLNLSHKAALAKEKAPSIQTDIEHLKEILGQLPFELTATQKRSLWEVVKDLEGPAPMNRLLQGDVGSGKTIVAALAAILAAIRGYQTGFMAPTEVLARQHFATLEKFFRPIKAIDQPAIGLLTSHEAKVLYGDDLEAKLTKKAALEKIKRGEIKIVIGTHALIQKSVAFDNLGLVIVDEQHRFGVDQRAELAAGSKKNGSKLIPHFLSMSATPIPRTLMLTIFGDLDVSAITELPTGRKNIITKVVPPEKRAAAYRFIREEVRSGRQAFVICPRIEKPEEEAGDNNFLVQLKLDTKSVKEEYEKLSKNVFPDLRVAMLHGQMKAAEKDRVMSEFRSGETDVLVSTSVIEVGVDVPNATVMMIEGSERFGLAQLYQFRGRVGRGSHQSYCLLFTHSKAALGNDRLKAIVEAKNGFELAERDLEIRGPGEFIGQKQTGLPDYLMRGLQDPELVRLSRSSAKEIVETNHQLAKYPALKERLKLFEKRIHLE